MNCRDDEFQFEISVHFYGLCQFKCSASSRLIKSRNFAAAASQSTRYVILSREQSSTLTSVPKTFIPTDRAAKSQSRTMYDLTLETLVTLYKKEIKNFEKQSNRVTVTLLKNKTKKFAAFRQRFQYNFDKYMEFNNFRTNLTTKYNLFATQSVGIRFGCIDPSQTRLFPAVAVTVYLKRAQDRFALNEVQLLRLKYISRCDEDFTFRARSVKN